MNSTNLHPISHRSPDIWQYWSNYCFWHGRLALTNSLLETSANIAVSHTLLQKDSGSTRQEWT